MMRTLHLKTGGLLSLALGPFLLLCIGLATVNMMSTYKQIHQQKQATLWSLIQLDRHIGRTVLNTQQYVDGQVSAQQLQQAYQQLQNSLPNTQNSLREDRIFQQSLDLSDVIDRTHDHVQQAATWMARPEVTTASTMNRWLSQLDGMNRTINEEVLDNVASTSADYAETAFATIIKTAAILLVVILTFIVYLGYLLFALRKERKRNLYMLAHDPLTELSSRECVMANLQSRCNNQTPFALLMFDLNKFKAVNDTFGHHAGDQLLIHLAGLFKRSLCQYGIVGRMGGDEFLWIAESDQQALIEQQFLQFQEALKTPCMIQGQPIYLHMSTGGGIAADHQFQITELLERVDQAMYQAKAEQCREIVWEQTVTQDVLRRNTSDSVSVKLPASSDLKARKAFPA